MTLEWAPILSVIKNGGAIGFAAVAITASILLGVRDEMPWDLHRLTVAVIAIFSWSWVLVTIVHAVASRSDHTARVDVQAAADIRRSTAAAEVEARLKKEEEERRDAKTAREAAAEIAKEAEVQAAREAWARRSAAISEARAEAMRLHEAYCHSIPDYEQLRSTKQFVAPATDTRDRILWHLQRINAGQACIVRRYLADDSVKMCWGYSIGDVVDSLVESGVLVDLTPNVTPAEHALSATARSLLAEDPSLLASADARLSYQASGQRGRSNRS